MNLKKLSLFIYLFNLNQKVFSASIYNEGLNKSLDSDSEDNLDSLLEDIELDGKDVTVFEFDSDKEFKVEGVTGSETTSNDESVSTKIEFPNIENEEYSKTSETILSFMDTSINPCDDFYQFTCGNYDSNSRYYNQINEQTQLVHEELYELISKDYIVNEKLSKEEQKYDKKIFDIIKRNFDICMNPNQYGSEQYGNEYIKDLINHLDIYEELEGNNDRDKFTNLLIKLESKGLFDILFNYSNYKYSYDDNDKIFLILSYDEDQLLFKSLKYSIYSRFFNTNEENISEIEIKQFYEEYIKTILGIVHKNEKDIKEMTEIIYNVEKKIYNINNELKSNSNPEQMEENIFFINIQNYIQDKNLIEYSLDKLMKKYSFINWKLYFEKKIEFYGIKNIDLESIPFYVINSYIFDIMNTLFNEINIKELTIFMEWCILISKEQYFSDDTTIALNEIDEKYNSIIQTNSFEYPSDEYYYNNDEYPSDEYYYNNDEYSPDESYYNYDEYPSDESYYNDDDNDKYFEEQKNACLNFVIELMPMQTAKYYTDRKLTESSRKEVKQIIEYVKESMITKIQKVDWLDEETKNYAIEKAMKMKSIIGYPEEFNNPKTLYENYKYLDIEISYPLTLSPLNTYYALIKNGNTLKYHEKFEMQFNYLESNAYYEQNINSMVIPASFLHLPIYSNNEKDYIKYGKLGVVIGHELTHGFDNFGRNYDVNGKKNNWWTDNDDKDFNNLSQCFIDQYNSFSYSINDEKYYVNGTFTLAENIADNSSVNRGYESWKLSMINNTEKTVQHNQNLSGLSDYSLEQLFFIAYGQYYCAKNTEYAQYWSYNVHAPDKARVNLSLQNSEYFAKAFNCPLGSPMNPKNKCLLW